MYEIPILQHSLRKAVRKQALPLLKNQFSAAEIAVGQAAGIAQNKPSPFVASRFLQADSGTTALGHRAVCLGLALKAG